MKFGYFCLAAFAVACVAGCRTTKDVLDDYERNMTAGNYAALPGEVAELAAKGDDSSLLWHLLAGAGYYMADDKANAGRQFDAAEDAMQRNDASSVFAQGAQGGLAMMTNDRSFPYDGGGQDRIFTCLYKSIDYMCAGNVTAARTELNRASQHQENWIWERRRDVDAAAQRMTADADAYAKQQQIQQTTGDRSQQTASVLADASFTAQIREKCGFDPVTSGDLSALAASDYMNAYAQHVCGVFRWLDGDGGQASLKTAAQLAPSTVAVRDANEAASGMRPSNQVWIWVEDGLCPCREEWRIDLPLIIFPGVGRYVKYAGMALPYLRERTWGAANWSVQAGGTMVPMADLANVDKLVKTEYDVYMRGALTREITRTIVKVGAQIALGAAADHTNDGNHRLALQLSQLGVAAWAASTTAADLRSWTALPKSVKCVRIDRPADGRIDVIADSQRIQLAVPPGNSMVFLRKPGPLAMPVAKQVTFNR